MAKDRTKFPASCLKQKPWIILEEHLQRWDACHELFCILGDFYASGTWDPEAGFSIKAGTRRLIATYFGIGSRLLCILFAVFLFFVCVQVFCLSLSSDFEFSLSYIVQNNQNNRDQISKLAGASLLNYRHVFNHVDIRVCNIDFGPALHGKTWLLREHASDSFLGLTPPYQSQPPS